MKTLKDMDREPCCYGINEKELKQAVLDSLREGKVSYTAKRWIKEFFNFSEAELNKVYQKRDGKT